MRLDEQVDEARAIVRGETMRIAERSHLVACVTVIDDLRERLRIFREAALALNDASLLHATQPAVHLPPDVALPGSVNLRFAGDRERETV